MSVAQGKEQEWTVRPERGTVSLIKFIVWVALRLGRPTARLLLYPICTYFLVFSQKPRRASRQYLHRALGRRPGLADLFRHYFSFAACILDRVFLLNGHTDLFDVRVHGEELVRDILQSGSGCLLIGAHFGSFEVARALGRRQPNLRVSLLMYEENARKIRQVLSAINPDLATDVIALGQVDSMMALRSRLERGHFVGMLGDRSLEDEDQVRVTFLGSPAGFPVGPFRMAALLKCPSVLMFGIYRGGRRYDVHFELLLDGKIDSGGCSQDIETAMRLYVARLEHHCRAAPFNWFNFYDFWK